MCDVLRVRMLRSPKGNCFHKHGPILQPERVSVNHLTSDRIVVRRLVLGPRRRRRQRARGRVGHSRFGPQWWSGHCGPLHCGKACPCHMCSGCTCGQGPLDWRHDNSRIHRRRVLIRLHRLSRVRHSRGRVLIGLHSHASTCGSGRSGTAGQ